MITNIAKLQTKYDVLYQKFIKAQELLADRKEKYVSLQNKYKYLEKEVEKKVQTSVQKFETTIISENEKLKEEVQRLKSLLNMDHNNGIPTSKTSIGGTKRIPNTREKTDKSKGGQLGHKKHKLAHFSDDEITDTYIHEVVKCNCGCERLRDRGIKTTKDSIDIDIRVQKIRNEFHQYECFKCGKILESPIPLNLKEENQYGSNVKALAVSLINEGCVSYNRTKQLISGFSNKEVNVSEGFLVKLQKKCFSNLTIFQNELKQKIINEKILCWDDTVIMVNKARSCLRYYGNKHMALYTAHEKKNKEGLDEDSILNNLTSDTTVVHDHNTVNYNSDYKFENAECCVHLIRDLKKISDNLRHKWSQELSELFINTNEERKQYMVDQRYFENIYIDQVIQQYDEIVKRANEENKKDYNKYYGQEERALIRRLNKYKANYLMWVVRFDVPFDNNLSERSLRMAKTKMKVSGQFSNISSAKYYAGIKSYIETCKRNGINEHMAIVKLLNGVPYTLDEILKNSNC